MADRGYFLLSPANFEIKPYTTERPIFVWPLELLQRYRSCKQVKPSTYLTAGHPLGSCILIARTPQVGLSLNFPEGLKNEGVTCNIDTVEGREYLKP